MAQDTEHGGAVSRRNFIASGAGVTGLAALGASAAETKQEEETLPPLGPRDTATVTLVQLTAGEGIPPVLDRMPAFFREAAERGSDLVVFPEYVLGHNLTPKSDAARRFFALAREHRINAVTGCVETHGDKWATSAWVVDRQGTLVGRYLKSHPASGPAPHFWPPVGDSAAEAQGVLGCEFKVFTLDFGPIGILQCYDGYFPEAWGCTSYLGAEIILWINGRDGMVEDAYCITAANCYGCVVGANITMGFNTGFAGPGCVAPAGGPGDPPEQMRLWPRVKQPGDASVTAVINLAELRWKRKHLRTMHQRRPEMYGLLTRDVKMWQHYPDIPWDHPECAALVNKAQL